MPQLMDRVAASDSEHKCKTYGFGHLDAIRIRCLKSKAFVLVLVLLTGLRVSFILCKSAFTIVVVREGPSCGKP